MTATPDAQEVKNVVKERYAARAKGAASCCGPEELEAETGAYPGIYLDTDISGLGPEVLAASAGCGNPTALAALKPGEVVLDLGSGGGIDCFLASRAVGPTGRVLGIDMTPEMVDLARRNAQKMGITNVEFHLGELEDLPFESNTMDVVISNCVICLSPDKSAVLREVFRVLKPRGRFHVSDMMLVGELPEEVRQDPEQWASCIAGAEQKETYLARLVSAGYEGISLETEVSYSPEPRWENLRSVRLAALKPAAG